MLVRSVGLRGGGFEPSPATPLKFGVITDIHYNSRKDPVTNRYHKLGLTRVQAAVTEFNKHPLDFVICMGDLIDHEGYTKANAEEDLGDIAAEFAAAYAPEYYMFGNHDPDLMTKAEYQAITGMSSGYYSFDVKGTRIVVLDGCYDADDNNASYANGNYDYKDTYINPAQRTWLADELDTAPGDVIVFCHQLLVTPSDTDRPWLTVTNAAAVRAILESAGNVIAVFTGHEHMNGRLIHNGIPYLTMMAATEGATDNAYGIITLDEGVIAVEGFERQTAYGYPSTLTPRVWIKADAANANDATAVGGQNTLRDVSGNERHPTQTTLSSQPTVQYAVVNGKPILRFDGSNDFLRLPDASVPAGSGGYTIFAVVKHTLASDEVGTVYHAGNNATNERVFLLVNTTARLNTGWHGNNLFSANNAAPPNTWMVLTTTFDGTNRTQRINGAAAGTDTPTGKNTKAVRNIIGASETAGLTRLSYWPGDIAEILVFPTGLGTPAIEAVEAYLADAYGVSI